MICAEWWFFELNVVVSSYFGVAQLAANAIAQIIDATLFMVPVGFQEGICSLVGSSIGANNVALGTRISKVTFVISYSCCALISVTIFVFRVKIAGLLTQDEQV